MHRSSGSIPDLATPGHAAQRLPGQRWFRSIDALSSSSSAKLIAFAGFLSSESACSAISWISNRPAIALAVGAAAGSRRMVDYAFLTSSTRDCIPFLR